MAAAGARLHGGDVLTPSSTLLVADVDAVVHAAQLARLWRPRVGTAAAAVISFILGRTVVAGPISSFRINGRHVREDLGWRPSRPRAGHEVTATVAATLAMLGRRRPGSPRVSERGGGWSGV